MVLPLTCQSKSASSDHSLAAGSGRLALAWSLALMFGCIATLRAADANDVQFFESRVRPVLAENCHRCHGPRKQEGNLRLDSVAAMRKGGDRGPAIEPGKPDASPLILAIRYKDQDFQMPPKGRLTLEQIADLETWVKQGAPAPDETPTAAAQPYKTFDLERRREHWCYQPVRDVQPPAVRDKSWPTSPVDHFILARLEEAGLQPAPPADPRTLIRRVTFDLTGLPPTPDEVDAFLHSAIRNPQSAFASLVDRLLDSPHYGERWARHWLDLVRYAETQGHEFDFELHHAWRYRDYVIRAFNADVPYNQFVIEHMAGDLLKSPRRQPRTGFNESILGTGFYWLGEGKHSPVDIRQEQANMIDNRIDVFGKTFLAQTIACARCHDHKFDAIAAADYYALAGYMKSTRYQQAAIDPPARITEKVQELARLKQQMRPERALATAAQPAAARVAEYLLAARETSQQEVPPQEIAGQRGLDAELLARWVKALDHKDLKQVQHPLFVWQRLPRSPVERVKGCRESANAAIEAAKTRIAAAHEQGVVFDDFSSPTWQRWQPTGEAFGDGPTQTPRIVFAKDGNRDEPQIVPAGWAHSGLLSPRLEGTLRSETFEIKHRYLHCRAAGRGSRIRLVIDGFQLIRSPIYGGLMIELKDNAPAWRTMDLEMWRGHRAYLELVDSVLPAPSQPATAAMKSVQPGDGYLAIDEIRFSEHGPPPAAAPDFSEQIAADENIATMEQLAQRYEDECLAELENLPSGKYGSVTLLNWLWEQELLPGMGNSLATPLVEYRRMEQSIPLPTYAPAAVDGTGEDEYVLHRGNYRTPGEVAPRRLMPAVCDQEQPAPEHGSGRLALAQRLVDPANPLLARVMVNRLWQHHFGEGIVRTPDDFGRMGQAPTHPELLDYLASEFIRRGWSIKQMHRLMLVSSTYRMASIPQSAIRNPHSKDPENRLLSHMNVRRLEAEAIRDAVLAVSGRLDGQLYGKSVPPQITPFMEGRGRPGASGPVDGDGRRSIYINVRRNFLTPMFLAFDYPIPFTTIGRRGVSNVPAQALAMMNGPFVVQEAQRWARRVLQRPELSTEQRIGQMYQAAFARAASEEETRAAAEFVAEQSRRHDAGQSNDRAWADLAHVLLNIKEFIFIE